MAQTDKQKVGEIGENVACKFLKKQGFSIKDRNYRKKWGEIDIVAQKDNVLHFIEVKAKTDLRSQWHNNRLRKSVLHLPEENVHPWKMNRLSRAIRTYLLENNVSDEVEWQIDIMAVFLDFKARKAKIRTTQNVIL